MTGLAIGALATTAVGTGIGVYSTYQQGVAAKEMAGQQAAAQLALAEAQAAAYGAQAGEYARQAAVERKLAGVDQIQGELENEKRSKALAAEIGSTYAQAAGNGILVTSASPTDTFANVLKNEATEAAYDISINRDNTAMNVWQRSENARKLSFAACQASAAAANALSAGRMNAAMTVAQGNNAYRSSIWSAAGQAFAGIGSLALGGAMGYSNGLFGFGSGGVSAAGAAGGSGTASLSGAYGTFGGQLGATSPYSGVYGTFGGGLY